MESNEILFGIATNANTASLFDPKTGQMESFDVYPFDYNNLQATAEEIFIQLLGKMPKNSIPGWTVWSGLFSDEEKKLLLQVAEDYQFKKIHFINVECAWSLNLLNHYNQKINENEKIGLILDLEKIVEGSLYRVIDEKLVRIRITYQSAFNLPKLNKKLIELFRSNFIKGRKCDTILVEYRSSTINYQKYFQKRTVIMIPYEKFNTSKGALIRAKILNGNVEHVNYEMITKTDPTLDIIDFQTPPNSPQIKSQNIQISA